MAFTITVINAAPGNADKTGITVSVPSGYRNMGVQVLTSSLNASDGIISIWESNDNTNFVQNTTLDKTIASSDTNVIMPPFIGVGCAYYQIKWAKGTNSNASSSVTVIVNFN